MVDVGAEVVDLVVEVPVAGGADSEVVDSVEAAPVVNGNSIQINIIKVMKKIILFFLILEQKIFALDWQIIKCPDGNCLKAGVENFKQHVTRMGLIGDKPLSVAIQDLVEYFLSFLSVLAVIYIMWAGAQMLLFPASEESSEKTKKIIISVFL